MKRSIFTCVVLLIVMAACHKDEVFNPHRRIITISTQTNTDIQPTTNFLYNKNTLTGMRIMPIGVAGSIDYTFDYNKDNTMSKIYNISTGERAELSYDHALLQRVDVYNSSNNRVSYMEVSHKGKKITSVTYYSCEVSGESAMSALLFPTGYELMHKLMVRKDNIPPYMKQYITYDGDNVSRMRAYAYRQNGDSVLMCSYSYTYDQYNNPFYGLPLPVMDINGYSKNNVLSEQEVYDNGYDIYSKAYISRQHSYECNKKYPIKHSMTENATFSDVKSVYDDNTGTYKDTVIVRRSGVNDKQYHLYDYAK